MAKAFTLPFIRKEQLAENTFSFYFARNDFPAFLPGQYLYLTLPHKNPDERGTSRYFTIASPPRQKEYLMITTRLIQSTFKETLHNLQKGNHVQIFGPMGWFLLPEHEAFEKVFIAGGIGITPFHSLLHSLDGQKLTQPVTLFASFKNRKDILFYKSLTTISNNNKDIRVIYTLTQENDEEVWSGEKGRVSLALLTKHIDDLFRPVYYIVGQSSMVASTKQMLLALGIPEEKIQIEDFTGY